MSHTKCLWWSSVKESHVDGYKLVTVQVTMCIYGKLMEGWIQIIHLAFGVVAWASICFSFDHYYITVHCQLCAFYENIKQYESFWHYTHSICTSSQHFLHLGLGDIEFVAEMTAVTLLSEWRDLLSWYTITNEKSSGPLRGITKPWFSLTFRWLRWTIIWLIWLLYVSCIIINQPHSVYDHNYI